MLSRTSIIFFLILSIPAFSQPPFQKNSLLYSDSFYTTSNWISEIEPLPNSSVTAKNNKLLIDTKGGVTIWFNKKLSGKILIEFKRKIIIDTGANDRLSDMNQFWMASDPRNKNLFTRNGKFEAYDSLQLYYAGIGGNTNTTTRFRKYHGDGRKEILTEYLDKKFLLEANKEYNISILVDGNTTSLYVNNNLYFQYFDPKPLSEGYFDFRSTWSRQEISDFKVWH